MSWTDPTPQQFPAQEPDGVKKLIGAVQDVAQRARDATKNLLRTAGIFLADTGMRIESALTVNGDFASTGSADITGNTRIGGTLDVDATSVFDGDSTFHGSVVIDGDLAVPNGSIKNAALENPVAFDSGKAISAGNSMNLTVAEQTFCSLSFVVPVGYTRALVQGQGSIGVVNPMTVISSVAGRVYIDHPNADPAFGARRWQSSNPGTDAAVSPVHAGDFAVAGGDTITVRLTVQGGTSTSWGATAGGATLSATVLLGR